MTSPSRNGTSVTTNRAAILNLLCQEDGISRTRIAEITGIPLPTVHRLCAQLKQDGMLLETRENKEGPGRPVHLLHFNARFRAVLSINVRGTVIDGAVMSLNDRILHEEHLPYNPDPGVGGETESYIRHIISMVEGLRRWANDQGIPCNGIGVGVPGIVQENGLVTAASELKWNEVPLQAILNTAFEDDVLIENNANASAYGESLAGAGAGKNPVVGYTMRHFGVGAGIIMDGRILRGHHGMAGEMGYTLTGRESLSRYYTYGGDLEWRISRISALEGKAGSEEREYLYDLIALSISNICLVVDPEIIVMDIHSPLPVEELLQGVNKRLVGRIPHLPGIVTTELGHRASVIGIGELIGQRVRSKVFHD
ncbi:ROK family transcriptional regulator [uncultured Bifidobacterium sp.]|uniref:ROK family transcriptional regulator n=1 Tax=uncultured Bifidobacterium sp. TaxID=165187 RepID=UPI002607C58A|nr:ROK family transcriptional regulator [uncultured Bifidobacterium sp.]